MPTIGRWGAPIDIALFAPETDDERKAVVKKLTEEIEGRMVQLTINAPDWYVLLALTATLTYRSAGTHCTPQEQQEICCGETSAT